MKKLYLKIGGIFSKNPFNPDYALEFVMKFSNTIKTSVYVDFLMESIVDYANNKKSSKCLCLKYLEIVIVF